MSFMSELREFAAKGSVIDLAVGVIIGGAFGKIVDSAVTDLVMPVIGRAVGGLDFTNLFVALKDVPPGVAPTLEAVRKAGVPVFAWGNFLTIAFNFMILAMVIFTMVRAMNRVRREASPAPPPAPAEDVVLLREIRDTLRK